MVLLDAAIYVGCPHIQCTRVGFLRTPEWVVTAYA